MKLELKDFQHDAADQLLGRLRKAIDDFDESGERWALSLSAPTGAGKTVIATAVIERLFAGDDEVPQGDPDAVVLWLTDQPSLNEQTRRKMIGASDVLGDPRLVTIDASFQADELTPGHVYFLNIQKLARNQPLVNRGNRRWRTIWETINATAARRRGHFVLIIDEAHRGMRRSGVEEEQSRTIVQRFILGMNGSLEPVPVVLGISATPERFNTLVDRAQDRTIRRTNVDPELVRASGLLKDAILLRHPDEVQPGDMTLFKAAVADWKETTASWSAYAEAEGLPPIDPILVVQVEDARSRTSDTASPLDAVLQMLAEDAPHLPSEAIGHAFDVGGPISVGATTIRYVKPEDVQEDPNLRVVLFKTSLTTGWDCPRAEVMFSFRKAEEYVAIAQLIGRMVRTPLARRVEGNDLLNTVALYLPAYNRDAVARVVERLHSNPDEAPPTETITKPVICRRNKKLPANAFEIVAGLPTFTVPSRGRPNQVARLMKLATLLVGDNIEVDALDKAAVRVLDVLAAERTRLEHDDVLETRVNERGSLEVRIVRITLGGDTEERDAVQLDVDDRNVGDLFRQAGNKLRDGFAVRYWRQRVQRDGIDPRLAKIESYVLATDEQTVKAVDDAAAELVVSWMNEHDSAIRGLSDTSRQRYYEVQGQAKTPEPAKVVIPTERAYPDAETRWPAHLLSTSNGKFPAALGGWEAEVLEKELAAANLVAWYRNPTGGAAAIRVPYRAGGVWKPMYPDFVFVHDIDGELQPSIIDPHGLHLADAVDKARGMAAFAEEHSHRFHRLDMVAKLDDGALRRVDLKSDEARKAVAGATDRAALSGAFEDFGTTYSS